VEVHHKPQPWRGWREFLKESGIVVLGVLTALAAEQLAENAHWAMRMAETRSQLRAELSGDLGSAVHWLSVGPCIDGELDDLATAVAAARRTGTLTPPAAPYDPMLTEFTSDAWLNARSLQVSDRLSQAETQDLSEVYFFATELKDDIVQLHQQAAALAPLRQPLDRIAPAEADDFSRRIDQARELQSRIHLAAILMGQGAARMGVPAPADMLSRATARSRQRYGTCVSDPAAVTAALRRPNQPASGLMPVLHLSKPLLSG
jgi:hypothetical protein